MQDESESLPATTDSIRLGVVGHRLEKLSEQDLSYLRAPVVAVLTLLDGLRHSGKPLTVVSSLAEGADRLVAHEALDRNVPIDVVLPYSRDRFELDFSSEASVSDYRSLLNAARTIAEPGNDNSESGAGYHWASEKIVANADVLIAIWDGEPGRGPGGTAWTIDSALAADVPVVWLLSRSPWSIDVVEPDGGLSNSPVHRLFSGLASSQSTTGTSPTPLSRKQLRFS